MSERGVIRNRQAAQQLRNFSGLRWGKVTPTDVDCFVEFSDRLYVFVEGKHHGAPLPYGQKLAFERLVDAVHKPPARWAFGLVVAHDTDIGGDVDFAKATVTSYRYGGEWIKPAAMIDCKSAIDKCIEYINRPQLKLIANA